MYYLEYLSPIAAGYKPGVRLVISSDEVIIERMNNIPKSDTDKYTKAFKQLLKEFRKYLPNNLKLEFVKVRDMYKTDEFEKELKHRLEWAKDEWKKFDKTKQEAYLRSSELNIKMNGKEAWHKLSKKEQGEKIAMGPIYHDGYINLKRRVKFVKGEDKIMLFTFTIKGIRCMPLGSTKASANKFWTGVGILERGEKGFKELILSPKQLKKLSKKCTMQRLDLIKLNNFKSIKIL